MVGEQRKHLDELPSSAVSANSRVWQREYQQSRPDGRNIRISTLELLLCLKVSKFSENISATFFFKTVFVPVLKVGRGAAYASRRSVFNCVIEFMGLATRVSTEQAGWIS